MSDRRLFHDEDAERFFKAKAGKPYRPSNGSEGEIFYHAWCAECAHDDIYRRTQENGCPIWADALAYASDDPNYPKQLVWDTDGQPVCKGFEVLRSALAARAEKPT